MTSARPVRDLVGRALPQGGLLPPAAFEQRHRGITALAWIHVATCAVIAGSTGALDLVSVAALLAAAALALGGRVGRDPARASLVTGSLLVTTALLIRLFDGLIELHFGFFVVIAVIALYQLWAPYLVGLGFVLVHHVVLGLWLPGSVYNHPLAVADPLLFAGVHVGFVVAEAAACLTFWKLNENALVAERRSRVEAQSARSGLEQVNGHVADLVAMMSHDLRTPVAVVSGYGDLLLESWDSIDDAARRSFVDRMANAGRTLDQMLSETLTMAALDADGLAPTPTPVELPALVREVVDSTLPDGLGEVVLDVDPCTAYVDRGQLRQIIANLLTNAAKYGALPLEVTARATGSTVVVRVADQGEGVPAEFVPHLFDRWARSPQARMSNVRGTGLGLHIVRELSHGNGGDVRYETTAAGGACFVVTLPAANRPPILAAVSRPAPVVDADALTA